MAQVYCVILDSDQMPRAKAVLTDIRGKNAFISLMKGNYDGGSFEEHQSLKLRIMNTDNEAETYHGRITKRQEDTLELDQFEMLGQTEKRDDVKVIVDKPVWVILTDKKTGNMRKFSAILRDISAGGVCVVTKEEIPEGGEFEIVYDLTRAVDVLTVKVVRRQKLGSGEFRYGCQFQNLHFLQEHTVREYVFKRHLGLIGRNWRRDILQ